MLIQEKKTEEKVITSPYDFPESYYMETDPAIRLGLLEQQDTRDAENIRRRELWDCRYEKMKKSEDYADLFLRSLLDLILLGKNNSGRLAVKRNRKQAMKELERLCLTRTEDFGEELLFAEMRHLVSVYIVESMGDPSYKSILFHFGKMKEERVRGKIRADVKEITARVPKALGLEAEFDILSRAGMDAMRQMEMSQMEMSQME